MVARLQSGLGADETQIYRVEGLLDLAELLELAALDRPDLKPEPWIPAIPPRLGRPSRTSAIFDEIRRGDVLVHQPYGSFRASFEVFAQAAVRDPNVIAMKTAVYRTSDDSVLVGSLIQCAEDGQAVRLPRRAEGALRRAAQHRMVARARAGGRPRRLRVPRPQDPREDDAHRAPRGRRAAALRAHRDRATTTPRRRASTRTSGSSPPTRTSPPTSPTSSTTSPGSGGRRSSASCSSRRSRCAAASSTRSAASRPRPPAGKHARIRLKLNHLVDPKIVEELYAASQAGAQVDIIARSTCALRPGVEGLSETIHVRSIVGRFLEHSRVYSFEADERVATYIGSPDLMQRNLDHRIEVLVPVENARVRQEINAILDSALADDDERMGARPDGRMGARRACQVLEAALAPRDDDATLAEARPPRRTRTACNELARPTPSRESRPCGWPSSMSASNSVRLLVASVKRSGLVREVDRDRVYLRLGDDAYRLGRIGHGKLDELADVADRFARRARAGRAERIETIVTAPGRQAANAEELVEVLEDATRSRVVALTAEDEGRLAWEGAVASLDAPDGTIAVVDLGGGSCEVALGTPPTGPTWVRSRDAGALRVTRELLPAERPTAGDVARARAALHALLDGVEPSRPELALAVGGTARALAKVVGPRFGPRKLDALADRIASEGAPAVDRRPRHHARTDSDPPRRNARAGRDRTPARLEARGRSWRLARGRSAGTGARRVRRGVAYSTSSPLGYRSAAPAEERMT